MTIRIGSIGVILAATALTVAAHGEKRGLLTEVIASEADRAAW